MQPSSRATGWPLTSAWWGLVVASLWILVTVAVGGFVLDFGPLHLASRDAGRATVVVALCAAAAAFPFRARRSPLVERFRPHVPVLAAIVALVPLSFGLTYGTYAAAGSDPYGYVTQAQLWLDGSLRVEQPLAAKLPWPNAQEILSPLGYRPSADGTAIVPTYAPGLPLLMASTQLVAGPAGPFLVGPLAAALAVWVTFLLGRRWFDDWTALAAAGWLALSPSFLFEAMWPMSDIPATALTLAGIVLATNKSVWSLPLRAVALLLLVLVRPNLAAVAAAVAIAPWHHTPSDTSHSASRTAALIGVLAGGIVIALVQNHLYGAPWRTGYGEADTLYGVAALWPNVRRYPVWLVQQHTPMILFALIPLVWRAATNPSVPRWAVYSVIGAVWASYLFYASFDDWWYLRFMLPSLPLLWLLAAASWRAVATRLPFPAGSVAVVLWLGWLAVCVQEARHIQDKHFTNVHLEEARYAAVGAFIDARLPANAIVLTSQHSGSVRHYGKRLIARWDALPPGSLSSALDVFESLGLRPYLALDDWEERQLLERLTPSGANLDPLGSALGEWRDPGLSRVYDPRQRRTVATPERIVPR